MAGLQGPMVKAVQSSRAEPESALQERARAPDPRQQIMDRDGKTAGIALGHFALPAGRTQAEESGYIKSAFTTNLTDPCEPIAAVMTPVSKKNITLPYNIIYEVLKEIKAESEAAFQGLVKAAHQHLAHRPIEVSLEMIRIFNTYLLDRTAEDLQRMDDKAHEEAWKWTLQRFEQHRNPLAMIPAQVRATIKNASPKAFKTLVAVINQYHARAPMKVTPEMIQVFNRHLLGTTEAELKSMDQEALQRSWTRLCRHFALPREPLAWIRYCVFIGRQGDYDLLPLQPEESILGGWKAVRTTLTQLENHQPALLKELYDLSTLVSQKFSVPMLRAIQKTSLIVNNPLSHQSQIRGAMLRESLSEEMAVINPLEEHFQGLLQEVYCIVESLFLESPAAFQALMNICNQSAVVVSEEVCEILESSGLFRSLLEGPSIAESLAFVGRSAKIKRKGKGIEDIYLHYPLELIRACGYKEPSGQQYESQPQFVRIKTGPYPSLYTAYQKTCQALRRIQERSLGKGVTLDRFIAICQGRENDYENPSQKQWMEGNPLNDSINIPSSEAAFSHRGLVLNSIRVDGAGHVTVINSLLSSAWTT